MFLPLAFRTVQLFQLTFPKHKGPALLNNHALLRPFLFCSTILSFLYPVPFPGVVSLLSTSWDWISLLAFPLLSPSLCCSDLIQNVFSHSFFTVVSVIQIDLVISLSGLFVLSSQLHLVHTDSLPAYHLLIKRLCLKWILCTLLSELHTIHFPFIWMLSSWGILISGSFPGF